jgi:HSP20 family molecular chaperone IbpA
MWAEACQLIEEAERLQRQFFRLGHAATRATWEPPVDVFEDEREVTVIVALPGVPPDRVEASYDARGLLVRAERRIPFDDGSCSIRRLEIPYGWFERRIPLPAGPLEPGTRKWVDGCLTVTLRKRQRSGAPG